jgi:hypothetical protein
MRRVGGLDKLILDTNSFVYPLFFLLFALAAFNDWWYLSVDLGHVDIGIHLDYFIKSLLEIFVKILELIYLSLEIFNFIFFLRQQHVNFLFSDSIFLLLNRRDSLNFLLSTDVESFGF